MLAYICRAERRNQPNNTPPDEQREFSQRFLPSPLFGGTGLLSTIIFCADGECERLLKKHRSQQKNNKDKKAGQSANGSTGHTGQPGV